MNREARDRFVLDFNPWGDDDSDYRVLRNEFMRTRYEHRCDICYSSIPPFSWVRAQTERYDGKVATFRFCPACCGAMAAREYDDGVAIEERYELGRKNAETQREAEPGPAVF